MLVSAWDRGAGGGLREAGAPVYPAPPVLDPDAAYRDEMMHLAVAGGTTAPDFGAHRAAAGSVRRARTFRAVADAVRTAFRGVPLVGYGCVVEDALHRYAQAPDDDGRGEAERLAGALRGALGQVLPPDRADRLVAATAAVWLPAVGGGPPGLAAPPPPPPAAVGWSDAERFLRVGQAAPATADEAVQRAPQGHRDWADVGPREWLVHCIGELQARPPLFGPAASGEDARAQLLALEPGAPPGAEGLLDLALRLIGPRR